MTTIWRVQQAQMIISIVFWSLTLTGIFYPYIRIKIFNDWLGPDNVFIGMMIIFLFVVALVLLFGYIYDKLKFWREQITVAQERNPYSYGSKVTPINFILWYAVLNPDDKEARKTALALLDHQVDDFKYNMRMREIVCEIEGPRSGGD